MRRKRKIMFLAIAIFCGLTSWSAPAEASIIWDIYSDAVIDEVEDYYYYGRIGIYDTPPDHTTVNMVGGSVDLMRAYDSSTLNMTGGSVNTLVARGSSTINVSGEAEIKALGANEWSTLNISGGDLKSAGVGGHVTLNISGGNLIGAHLGDYGTLNISGNATLLRVGVYWSGVMNVTGGKIGWIWVSDSALVNVHGGLIEKGIGVGREEFNGMINLYGYDLAKTSSGGEYGFGQVYGFYPDGSEFAIDLGEGIYPYVNLIPEPGTLVLLVLGGVIVRRRRQ